ncbi:Dynamin family protein [Microbulbifer thermotolerans]|uniref:dynamin family protein n=1 Tax=Microbulbifer thermotolerans TaxID=252514 RepID=UPI0008F131FD|nr:dynamin family protein [Microbulbifer thermotolerans]SFD16175.1 Dynamin family protein [Microbulbifer thermotolerans]
MENARKSQLLSYLNDLGKDLSLAVDHAPSLLGDVHKKWSSELDDVVKAVSESDVFVPFVGGFSAGKSTALNSLIERQILPEKVSPETAIPTELRYSESERIMALSAKGEWTEHGINDLADLSAHADQYQVVRVYVKAQCLKDIEPLVLVDMPGFDSGLDQHNQAILRYITTGALYLYMVSAKAGTVSRQDVRRIEEILDLGRSVKVYLTMTDLASPEELEAIHAYVSDHMSFVTGDSEIGRINKDDISALKETLAKANVNQLFDGLVLSSVRNLYFDASSHVNTAINALSTSAAEVAERTKAAEQSLQKVERERERMLAEVGQGQLSEKTEQVIRKLEQTLNNSLDELVMMARTGEAALSRGVGDLVRSTLTVEIQRVVRRITTDVAYQFSGDISVGGIAVSGGSNWVNNMISVIENEAMNALVGLSGNKASGEMKAPAHQGGGIKDALSIAALSIPNPVLKVVFAILPGIIGNLFDRLREKNESEQYRQVISSQVIPGVIAQVRPQVLSSLNSIESEIIKTVSDQVTAKVEAQRAIYNEVAEASEAELEKLQNAVEALKRIRADMSKSAEGVIA